MSDPCPGAAPSTSEGSPALFSFPCTCGCHPSSCHTHLPCACFPEPPLPPPPSRGRELSIPSPAETSRPARTSPSEIAMRSAAPPRPTIPSTPASPCSYGTTITMIGPKRSHVPPFPSITRTKVARHLLPLSLPLDLALANRLSWW